MWVQFESAKEEIKREALTPCSHSSTPSKGSRTLAGDGVPALRPALRSQLTLRARRRELQVHSGSAEEMEIWKLYY